MTNKIDELFSFSRRSIFKENEKHVFRVSLESYRNTRESCWEYTKTVWKHSPVSVPKLPLNPIRLRVVKGVGGQDHVSRKINCSFHNSREIISAFDVSREKWHFLAQSYVTYDI